MPQNRAPMTAGAIYAAIASLSPAQQTMLTEISKHAEPVTVTELADALTLHPNSVRTTLDSLTEVRLIDRQVIKSGGRGRPSWGYFTLAPDTQTYASTQLVELTTLFCDTLRENFEDPEEQARKIGHTWGDKIVEQINGESCIDPSIQADIDIDARISQMRVLFTSLGTSAAINKDDSHVIDLHSCPFVNRAGTVDPLICHMHAGFINSVMECACGLRAEGELSPMREPGVCQISIREGVNA